IKRQHEFSQVRIVIIFPLLQRATVFFVLFSSTPLKASPRERNPHTTQDAPYPETLPCLSLTPPTVGLLSSLPHRLPLRNRTRTSQTQLVRPRRSHPAPSPRARGRRASTTRRPRRPPRALSAGALLAWTLPAPGLRSTGSQVSEKAHSGFSHKVRTRPPEAGRGAKPGWSGNAGSPTREQTCGDRHLLLQPDAAACTHSDVSATSGSALPRPSSSASRSASSGLRPWRPSFRRGVCSMAISCIMNSCLRMCCKGDSAGSPTAIWRATPE
uniref:Uncharacterized protein n=1 Tax=Mustela putorius furo TaxID=9669 RepID=M3XPK6_MUSPF